MGSPMNTYRTLDTEIIKEVMTAKDMWETVAEDGQFSGDFSPDMTQCWLLQEIDGEVIALYIFKALNSVTLEMHINVVPCHRKKHRVESARCALFWIYNNAPEYSKIVAPIPVIYENIKRFAKSFGFQVEGVNRLSYRKNNNIVDQWMLGITREELEDVLNDQCSK